MPSTNGTSPIIGMTITTTGNALTSFITDVGELNDRKMDHRRMLQLMQYPPPMSSVLVPSQERRSLTSSTEEVYDENDDGSVSSCSIEVMSVNAPYEYYNHAGSWGESASPQCRLDSSHNTGMIHNSSCYFDDEEGNQTASTGSTGSEAHEAFVAYFNGPQNRHRPLARRRCRQSQRGTQPPPQQMARILACSSPEITALCKSSFHLPNNHKIPTRQRGGLLQRQVASDMSIGSFEYDAHAVSSPPPDLLLESTSTTKSLFIPPPPPPPCPLTEMHRQQIVSDSPCSPVRTGSTIPRIPHPPTWTDLWLNNGRDEKFLASSAHISSLPSEEEEVPYMSCRSLASPMLHYSDSCIHPTCNRSQPTRYHDTTVRNDGDCSSGMNAIISNPLSKLSLHRRVSYDRLPSWNQIVVASTTENHQLEAPIVPIHYQKKDYRTTSNDTANGLILEKLLLHKTVTVVSDETMG